MDIHVDPMPNPECPQCGGDRPISLGLFGDVFYWRCRYCGWGWGEWTREKPADPPPDQNQ